MIKKLHLYIVKDFFWSFVFGIGVFLTILTLNEVSNLVNLFLSKRVAFFLILKLFVFFLPNIFMLAIPMAVLFGILLTYGKLSENNEITAMKSSGINYNTITIPIIICTFTVSLFLVFFNHFLVPSINSNFINLSEKIITKNPLVKFTEKSTTKIGAYYLYANRVNNRNNTLSEVSIYKFNNNKKEEIKSILPQNNNEAWRISASLATVKAYRNGIQLNLYNGYWQKAHHSNMDSIIHTTFKTYTFFIPLCNVIKTHFLNPSEITSSELIKIIKKYKKRNLPFIAYERNFWIRWIFAFAPLSFASVALPIGIMLGKSGKAMGFVISLGVLLVYYTLFIFAIYLSEKGYVSSSIIMWVPNFVITTIGFWLFIKMIKK
jgi:lipopolysaccharide export system permease protein